jgi:hypothetical protein
VAFKLFYEINKNLGYVLLKHPPLLRNPPQGDVLIAHNQNLMS